MYKHSLWLYIFASVLTMCCNIDAVHAKQTVRSKKKPSPKEFIIMTCRTVGMFSTLTSVSGALLEFEKSKYAGVKVQFGTDGAYGTYHDPSRGPNWWEYYFEPVYVGREENTKPLLTYNGPPGSDFAMLTELRTSRKRVHEIVEKYIHPKPHIQKIVDDFVAAKFTSDVIIGVHYRGTDKFTEARRAAYEEMTGHINQVISEYNSNNFHIFVATDEQAFLEYVQNLYPGRILSYNSIRSTSGSPVHLSSPENYKKGEDAIVDCLLLSKCNHLIKTSSNLSLFSSYFNPYMPVVHVTCRPWHKPVQ